MKRLNSIFCILPLLIVSDICFADCVSDISKKESLDLYNKAKVSENIGYKTQALIQYKKSSGFTCEDNKDIQKIAIKRASILGKELGDDQFKSKNYFSYTENQLGSFQLYELGGHYKLADESILLHLKINPFDEQAYEIEKQVFSQRTNIKKNNIEIIKETGAYEFKDSNLEFLKEIERNNYKKLLVNADEIFNGKIRDDLKSNHKILCTTNDSTLDGRVKITDINESFMSKTRETLIDIKKIYFETKKWKIISERNGNDVKSFEDDMIKYYKKISSETDYSVHVLELFKSVFENNDMAKATEIIKNDSLNKAKECNRNGAVFYSLKYYDIAESNIERINSNAGQVYISNDSQVPIKLDVNKLERLKKEVKLSNKGNLNQSKDADDLAKELGIEM